MFAGTYVVAVCFAFLAEDADGARPRRAGPKTLGEAVRLAEAGGGVVVRAESKDGVFTVELEDGTEIRIRPAAKKAEGKAGWRREVSDLFRAGKYAQAEKLCDRIVRERPESVDALDALGRAVACADRQRDAKKVRERLDEIEAALSEWKLPADVVNLWKEWLRHVKGLGLDPRFEKPVASDPS
jgi:hypothetical protein